MPAYSEDWMHAKRGKWGGQNKGFPLPQRPPELADEFP